MKRNTIDASREVRLWIGQVIIPAAMLSMSILSIPGVKESISEAVNAKREEMKNKFRRN